MEDLLGKAPTKPSRMPTEAPPEAVSSSPQVKSPVEAAQPRVWPSASQSVRPEPKVEEAEAKPESSRVEPEALVKSSVVKLAGPENVVEENNALPATSR